MMLGRYLAPTIAKRRAELADEGPPEGMPAEVWERVKKFRSVA